MNFKNTSLLLFFVLCTFSCSQNKKNTIIKGNINNLPDGTIYLYKDTPENRIDSGNVENGIFNLVHVWEKDAEPFYLGIDHVDKKGVTRAFNFPTNSKYKGSGWNSPSFFSDSIILINGKITDFKIKDIKLPETFRFVTSPKINAGKQTKALYNIDNDLFENINNTTIQTVKNKLKQYPYSYHLLYKIYENKNSFSSQQIFEFLKLFKGEITQSDTYKKVYTYNEKRFNKKKNSLPLLEDNNGVKEDILNKNYKKHLVIFWASWCGPCRQEIPLLKKIYQNHNKEIEFVSISVDNDKKSWQKALLQENIGWKQLIANEKNPDYEKLQILFKLNKAIPYTVLVDNDMKILATFTGLSDEKELEKLINQ